MSAEDVAPPRITMHDRLWNQDYLEQAFLAISYTTNESDELVQVHDVAVRRYVGNSRVVPEFGDARPEYAAAEAIPAVVEHARVEENQVEWGTDERVTRIVRVLTRHAEEMGVTARDRVVLDGVEHDIHSVFRSEGMGHVPWETILRVFPQNQTPVR